MIPKHIYKKILDYFNGDKVRADLWFRLDNPVLNGVSPQQYIDWGKAEKLEKLIDIAIDQDKQLKLEKNLKELEA